MKEPIIILASVIFCGKLIAAEPPSAIMSDEHVAVLSNHCYKCHGEKKEKGGVNLQNLSPNIGADIQAAERWQEVLNVINAGEMPPEDEEQMSALQKKEFLAELSQKIVVGRKMHADNGGAITLRRLNRREYVNTIEHLLGVRVNAESLPDDQPGGGFDTAGASLYFSSEQLQQYLKIGEEALQSSTAPHPAAPALMRRSEAEQGAYSRESYQKRRDKFQEAADRGRQFLAKPDQDPEDFGFKTKRHALKAIKEMDEQWGLAFQEYNLRPETEDGALLLTWQKFGTPILKTAAISGQKMAQATIRVRAAALPDVDPRYHYLEFIAQNRVDGSKMILGWRKVNGTLEKPEIVEFSVTLPLGELVNYGVNVRTHEKKSGGLALYFPDGEIKTPSGVWVDWVEIERPAIAAGPTVETAEFLFPKPDDWNELRYAREVIRRFATRAFRTVEPSAEYLDKLVGLFEAQRENGKGIREALLRPLSVILASPTFLYMVESNGNELLSDLELAVRLSYFLWSAPPDDELMKVAREGRLSEQKELAKQTERLLGDTRVSRFIKDFGHQWLGMERLGMFQFDPLLHPKYDNAVLQSARDEIYQTLHHALDRQLSLETLLKADFVFVNDVMADYYGIEGVTGEAFRKVTLPPESIRGGLLSTAAILAMGADGIRTSPVERGAWVLRHILHDPPPPAPPNVPQLDRLGDHLQPVRLLQRAHQEEAQCAQCHQKIDPIGYAMENFDAAGLWREQEVIRHGRNKILQHKVSFAIDPRGKLADGTRFENFPEFRDAVADRTPDFARGLAESLIGYGLGRPYGFSDHDLAESILIEAKKSDYALDSFIHTLVQSRAFRSK